MSKSASAHCWGCARPMLALAGSSNTGALCPTCQSMPLTDRPTLAKPRPIKEKATGMEKSPRRPARAIVAIIDTREQSPLDLSAEGLLVVRETLQHGDYSLKYPDLRKHICVERKSLADFVACCGVERERFMRECLAMRGYRWRFVVGEFNMDEILGHEYRSKIATNSVAATMARLMADGISFCLAGSPAGAAKIVGGILRLVAQDVIKFAKMATESLPAGEEGEQL